MTQHALARTRRSKSKEPMLRLIAFQLRHQWFCLPLASARRVLPKQPDTGNFDMGLIQLQNEAVPIVNTANLVYGGAMLQLPGQAESMATPLPQVLTVQSIVVVELPQGGAAGLLVDGTPTIRRVRQSALKPVPTMYLTMHRLRGISSVVDLQPSTSESDIPLFLLEIEKLLSHL